MTQTQTTPGFLAQVLLPGALIVRRYSELVLKNIPADRFARFAEVEGRKIESNHPAFAYGHLSLYWPRALRMLGVDASEIDVPESWQDLFKDGAPCRDDVDGSIYPPRDAIINAYLKGFDAVLAAVANSSDEVLSRPPEDEKSRARYHTVAAQVSFLMAGHPNLHAGQVSAWRRCEGLGAAS